MDGEPMTDPNQAVCIKRGLIWRKRKKSRWTCQAQAENPEGKTFGFDERQPSGWREHTQSISVYCIWMALCRIRLENHWLSDNGGNYNIQGRRLCLKTPYCWKQDFWLVKFTNWLFLHLIAEETALTYWTFFAHFSVSCPWQFSLHSEWFRHLDRLTDYSSLWLSGHE